MREFEWNVVVDESIFSLDVPAGYKIAEQEADAGTTASDAFVKMLKFYVRLNDEQFPDEFSTMMFLSIPKLLTKPGASKEDQQRYVAEKLAHALDRPDVIGMSKEERIKLGMELQQPFGRGAMFYETTRQSHHCHFQGNDIKLGEAEKIVAWWYPKEDMADEGADLNTAHVLYGDLRIETMPVDELPIP